jgi:hypothetical protein
MPGGLLEASLPQPIIKPAAPDVGRANWHLEASGPSGSTYRGPTIGCIHYWYSIELQCTRPTSSRRFRCMHDGEPELLERQHPS